MNQKHAHQTELDPHSISFLEVEDPDTEILFWLELEEIIMLPGLQIQFTDLIAGKNRSVLAVRTNSTDIR